MLEIVQTGKRAAAILFIMGTVFIVFGIILFVMYQIQTEYCTASVIFGIGGIFALYVGFYGRKYKIVIKMDEEKLTIIGPQNALKEFKLDEIEKAEIVRKGQGSSITFHPREKTPFRVESAGIAENDMEKLISAVKDAGHSHDFDVVEKGRVKKVKNVALSPEKMEVTGENRIFSTAEDKDDAPYKVK